MRLSRADLPPLRIALLAALLMIAAGSFGAYLAFTAERRARLELAAAQQTRDAIDGRLRRMRGEETEIRQKAALFDALQARGVIGDEQRLEWVELIKAISERHHLLDLRYEIAAQQPLDGAVPTAGDAAYTFYASRMRIELELLHEEDLTRLLDDLRRQARALIRVRQCSVERLAADGKREDGAQLHASCLIDWITLRRADPAGAQP